jgi:holin-like protein
MLSALTQLLIFQLVGEVTARGFNLPIPGPVLGMLFLFIALMIKGGPGKELQGTSQTLLQHLSLLFVPAGTGIMVHLNRVASEWLPLMLAGHQHPGHAHRHGAGHETLPADIDHGRTVMTQDINQIWVPFRLPAPRPDHHPARLSGCLLDLSAHRQQPAGQSGADRSCGFGDFFDVDRDIV